MKPKGEVSLIMTPANEGSVSFITFGFTQLEKRERTRGNPAWLFGSGEVKRSGAGSNTPTNSNDLGEHV